MAHFISVIPESWLNLGLSEQDGENHSAHNKNYAFENWIFWNSEEEEKYCDFLSLVEINAFLELERFQSPKRKGSLTHLAK